MTTHASSSQAAATSLGRTADLIMLGTLLVYSAAALAIGSYYGSPGLAAGVSLLLLLVGGAAFSTAGGSGLSRSVLAVCLSAAVALHIHLGRGTLEFHFGVFVTLALLLVYRDWRPIVVTAAASTVGMSRASSGAAPPATAARSASDEVIRDAASSTRDRSVSQVPLTASSSWRNDGMPWRGSGGK